ncbi:MAG TPA: hypothetical protein VK575_06815 [Gemmatimonadaceae bacterium]|nr:hypothetical protein [Gemmatimonadaceae bacterium]
MNEKRKADAIAAARSEIAKRIARFCTTLSPEELDLLLDRMARVQWKYQVMPVDCSPADRPPRPRELLE